MDIFEYIDTIPAPIKPPSVWGKIKDGLARYKLWSAGSALVGFYACIGLVGHARIMEWISPEFSVAIVGPWSLLMVSVLIVVVSHENYLYRNKPASDDLKKKVVFMLDQLSSTDPSVKELCKKYLHLLDTRPTYWWQGFLTHAQEHLNAFTSIDIQDSVVLLQEKLEGDDILVSQGPSSSYERVI